MQSKPVTIVGGGLAGLALGIGLRRCGVAVTLREAGRYPRHRVCGEFISGRGQATLDKLGLRQILDRAGAVYATTAAFFTVKKTTTPRKLPAPAICLSRFDMDNILAETFRKAGGELLEESRWQSDDFGEGIVRATGRRLRADAKGSQWLGLKIHAFRGIGITQMADLELHVTRNGYVGLCRINGGLLNVCGLFRHKRRNGVRQPRDLLHGEPGSVLHERLEGAEFDEDSFCSVAGLSLVPQRAASWPEFSLGDTITMIPPMTGNGMSMAFESAEMAIEPLVSWSRGEITWLQAKQLFSRACDTSFSQRLKWAKWLQRLALMPAVQNILLRCFSKSERSWRLMFERTR